MSDSPLIRQISIQKFLVTKWYNALVHCTPDPMFQSLGHATLSTCKRMLDVGFCGGKKAGDPGVKPFEQGKNQQ